MITISEDNIINQDNECVDFSILEKITSSEIKKCTCKIKQEIDINNTKKLKTGTGFFCNVPSKNIKVFITNNHVLDQNFLNKENTLNIFIEEKKKIINLNRNRFILTEEKLDFTIIEILDEDNLDNFLEIDEFINTENYEGDQIFTMQYPGGKKLQYSHGKITKKINNYFLYSLGTDCGSSGAPIILFENSKLIGLHRGEYKEDKTIKVGIPINLIINKINKNTDIYKTNNNNFELLNANKPQEPKDILPRVNKTVGENDYSNNEIKNITFKTTYGMTVLINAPKKTTIKELIRMFLKKINISEEKVNLLLFIFIGKKIDAESEKTIEIIKNLSTITVADINNVRGA